MNLEDRLRRALRRMEPDEDFAARVLFRLDDVAPRAERPVRRWALAASVVLALAVATLAGVGSWEAHTQRVDTRQLQARQQAAGRELAFALDLTSRELERVRRHLNRQTEETGS
jgi:hypothetical protein